MDRDRVIADLKQDEGWVPHVYQDHLGYWTIGYGFMVDPRKGGEIPRHVADFWLRSEIENRLQALRDSLPSWDDYPEGVKRALVNMSYQLGIKGLLGFTDMIQALDYKCYDMAADCALESEWARQTPDRANRVSGWIRNA